MILPRPDEVRSERARRSYLEFVRQVFPELNGGEEYEVNWHHSKMAKKLQEFCDPDSGLDRLMIFMPPQHGKSQLTSRCLPGWILGHTPNARIIGGSYAEKLALSMSRDAKKILNSDAYRRIFPDTQIPSKHVATDERHSAKNTAGHWEIVGRNGSYMARGSGQGVDGNPADFLLLDDVLSQQTAKSAKERQSVYEWWAGSLRARLSKKGKVLLVMTRWHLDDIAGRLLDEARSIEGADQWEVIEFPAIKESDDNPHDPREIGEVLWPEFKDLDALMAIKGPNPDFFEALYQQNPTPPGGTVIKTGDLQYWTSLPSTRGTWIQSWDLRAGGKSATSSYAVGQLWLVPASQPANAYLVDQVRGRWDINETLKVMLEKADDPLWSRAVSKIVENKADGRAVIPILKDKVTGIEPVKPTGSKEARLQGVAPLFRGGNVYIPCEEIAPWVREYAHEITNFPGTANDDQVDTTTQALSHLLIPNTNKDDPADHWGRW